MPHTRGVFHEINRRPVALHLTYNRRRCGRII